MRPCWQAMGRCGHPHGSSLVQQQPGFSWSNPSCHASQSAASSEVDAPVHGSIGFVDIAEVSRRDSATSCPFCVGRRDCAVPAVTGASLGKASPTVSRCCALAAQRNAARRALSAAVRATRSAESARAASALTSTTRASARAASVIARCSPASALATFERHAGAKALSGSDARAAASVRNALACRPELLAPTPSTSTANKRIIWMDLLCGSRSSFEPFKLTVGRSKRRRPRNSMLACR
jgi:hypothetical protein